MTKIRPALIGDIPAMGNLWAELVLEELPKARPDISRWCQIQHMLISNPDYHAWVSEDNGEVTGFTNGMVQVDIQTGQRYMDGGHLFVTKQHRKGMAGLKLHRVCYRVCRDNGARFVRRKVSAFNKRMVDRMNKHLGNGHTIIEYIVDETIGGTK